MRIINMFKDLKSYLKRIFNINKYKIVLGESKNGESIGIKYETTEEPDQAFLAMEPLENISNDTKNVKIKDGLIWSPYIPENIIQKVETSESTKKVIKSRYAVADINNLNYQKNS